MNKKLKVITSVLITLAACNLGHAYKLKDFGNQVKGGLKHLTNRACEEFANNSDECKAKRDKWANEAGEFIDSTREQTTKHYNSARDWVKSHLSKDKSGVFSVDEFKKDTELFYHYSALATNLWEYKGTALGATESDAQVMKNSIEQTKARLQAIANDPESKGLSLELIDQFAPKPEEVDPSKICLIDSPLCQETMRDLFLKSSGKLNDYWTKYSDLFPEIVPIQVL